MDELTRQFQAGVDDYWRGYIPQDWDDEAHQRVCAYHAGWIFAARADQNQEEVECPDA